MRQRSVFEFLLYCSKENAKYLISESTPSPAGTVKIAYWDTEQQGGRPRLLGEIKGTPTIRLYNPKKKQKPGSNVQKVVNDYNYERKAVDMKKFLDAQMPDFVEKIKEPKDLAKFEEKANRNQLPRVLLFSSKPNTLPLTKYLSTEFRRRILLGEVKPNKNNAAIQEKYGVTEFPALIVIPVTAEGEEEAIPIRYDGDGFTRNKLHGFLSKHALKDPVLAVKKKEEDKGGASGQEESPPQDKAEDKSEGTQEKQKVHSSEL